MAGESLLEHQKLFMDVTRLSSLFLCLKLKTYMCISEPGSSGKLQECEEEISDEEVMLKQRRLI